MAVAGIGVFINAATAALFMAGRKADLNIRGAVLEPDSVPADLLEKAR